jgi:hypothetical protein
MEKTRISFGCLNNKEFLPQNKLFNHLLYVKSFQLFDILCQILQFSNNIIHIDIVGNDAGFDIQ